MDEDVLERAKRHIEEAREGRSASRFDAALERARTEIESLTVATAALESGLPERVTEAVQDGLRREVAVVGRNLAEIRGLLNNAIRRLERLEQEVLAERHARIDDLALLVDLVSAGWRSVDARLVDARLVDARLVDARLDQLERPEASDAHVLPLAADAA